MIDLLERMYELVWRERDLDAAFAQLPDEFEWVMPGHPDGAVRRGRQEVNDFFRDWIGQWDEPELSRGAESAVFVERDERALTALRRNLDAIGADAAVRRQDVLRFLARPEGTFDLVFCDPPYDVAPAVAGALAEALPALTEQDARIVTESDKRNPLVLPLPLLVERAYGDTRIAIHAAT